MSYRVGMVGLLVIAVVTGVLLTAGTLIWWKLGDAWADAEHRRFKPRDAAPPGAGPTVIRRAGPAPGEGGGGVNRA